MVIVTTIGRSASSAVAGMLFHLDVNMGNQFVPANQNNPAGHWEDAEFKRINQEYIHNMIPKGEFQARVQSLANQRSKPWGFKVPSTATVLPDYLDILDTKVIWVKRDERDIKQSMIDAYDWDEKHAQDLIDRRLSGIKQGISEYSPEALELEYEDVVNNPESVLDDIINFLNLEPTESQKQDALDSIIQDKPENPKVWVSVLNQGDIHPGLSNVLLNMGDDPRVQVHMDYPSASPEVGNRNKIANNFMESDYDYLITIDSDVVPHKNPLDLVFLNKDVVDFAVPQWRDGDLYWVAMDEDGQGWKPIPPERRRGLQKVNAVGQGCIVYARRVFRKLDQPYFRHRWHDDGTFRGQEFLFCGEIREKDMNIWVHWDYPASHFKTLDLMEIAKLLGDKNG